MQSEANTSGLWHGFIPPQYIFANRRFKGVALDPPDFEPGSWIGAGKALFNHQTGEFLLTARPRRAAGGVLGFAANIYHSRDGEHFDLVTSISKETISDQGGLRVHSIEGTQLLKDPLTGRWHLYMSVDTGSEFVWGGLYWETLLLTASDLQGPWQVEGLVLHNDQPYDANQARDCTIDIVDGRWLCVYRAVDEQRRIRPALATSTDGVAWDKHGTLTVDGHDRLAFLSGSLFEGSDGPLFMGLERPQACQTTQEEEVYADTYRVGHGGGPVPNFVAYRLDRRHLDLETIFRAQWEPASPYEHGQHPLLGYASLAYDPLQGRMLIYVEAIERYATERIGLNETVERLLLYETAL